MLVNQIIFSNTNCHLIYINYIYVYNNFKSILIKVVQMLVK